MDDPRLVDEDMTGLAVRARGGDEAAFRELVTRCYPRIHRWALQRMADPDDADDVVQDVLVRLHRTLRRFRGDSRLTTWLYQVTRNVAIDHQRRRARRREVHERHGRQSAEAAAVAEAPAQLERDDTMAAVRVAFDALPARQREVFDLVDLQGYPAVTAAEMLALDPGTVRVHLFRARRTVRRAILEMDSDWKEPS